MIRSVTLKLPSGNPLAILLTMFQFFMLLLFMLLANLKTLQRYTTGIFLQRKEQTVFRVLYADLKSYLLTEEEN